MYKSTSTKKKQHRIYMDLKIKYTNLHQPKINIHKLIDTSAYASLEEERK